MTSKDSSARLRVFCALALLLIAGCSEAALPNTADQTATLVPQARIRSDDGPPLTTINQIVATNDFVFVGQEGEQEILVYDVDGAYVRTIGREGSGPGEFVSLRRFGVQGDTIWTIDWGVFRLSRFTTRGELLDDLNLEPYRQRDETLDIAFTLLPEQLTPRGEILGFGGTEARRMADGSVLRNPIVRWSQSRNATDTLGWYDIRYYGLYLKPGFYWSQPIETVTLVVYDGAADRACVVERDQLARAGVATVDITCLAALGDTVWQRSVPYEPVAIPATVVDSARDSRMRPLLKRYAEADVDAALYIPTHWPPVDDGFAGADRSLWLRGPALGETVTYTVFNHDGSSMTRINVPRSLRILWADATSVWAQELDADDVPTLARFSIERSAGMP